MQRPERIVSKSYITIIALLLSILAVLAGYLVSDRIFEDMAHIEDEMAYVWQAQAIARGHLSLPSPPEPKSFLIPFVVDYNGQRFGKYPLGWPVVLAFGVLLGIRSLVNPLLGGVGVWLTYRLGQRLMGEKIGLIAAALTVTSPFFLMNTGSLLSHPLGLVLSATFTLGWLDAFFESSPLYNKPRLPTLVAAFSLGLLALTRPFTAVAVGLPFGLHGLYLLWRGDWPTRRRLICLGVIVLGIASLHFVWQYAMTGDPLLNPYTLWWDYDKIGFGAGHGHDQGHSLFQAWVNTKFSLWVGYRDLFGWGTYSWTFLPLGLLAVRHDRRSWLVTSIFPSLVIVYMAYWIGSYLFGPRYFYESLFCLTLLSAAGIAWLAGWPIQTGPTEPEQPIPATPPWQHTRSLGVMILVTLLVSINLLFYTPPRLQMMHGLYNVQRSHIEPFLTASAQELTPALVIVHISHKWIEYGTLIELENPFLDTPFIFVISHGIETDSTIPPHFPERRVYHYYPDEPYKFYLAPRP
ncbi:MAG: hypothetical protein AB1894_01065 [Chloroflexota bacterium]